LRKLKIFSDNQEEMSNQKSGEMMSHEDVLGGIKDLDGSESLSQPWKEDDLNEKLMSMKEKLLRASKSIIGKFCKIQFEPIRNKKLSKLTSLAFRTSFLSSSKHSLFAKKRNSTAKQSNHQINSTRP
jgi:hypothetical protein